MPVSSKIKAAITTANAICDNHAALPAANDSLIGDRS